MSTPPSENFAHQTIWTGDNLPIMRGLNSDTVDLIYLDPPFNSNANYAAPIGSRAAGAAFRDTWGLDNLDSEECGVIRAEHPNLWRYLLSVRDIHSKSQMSYLIYMAPRLMEMRRLLKPTGSIYLHCDQTASHYLKGVMDAIFGRANFRNEIIWHYNKWTNAASYWQRNHDILLFYSKTDAYEFEKQYWMTDAKLRAVTRGWDTNNANGVKQLLVYDSKKAAEKMNDPKYEKIVNLEDKPQGTAMADVWSDITLINSQAKERTGYPTQKPLDLLRRIIKASSNEGDMVLDPFCGCATTCVAAQDLLRRWVGIDISEEAKNQVLNRLTDDLGLRSQGVTHRTDQPHRTDVGDLPPYKSHKQPLYGQQQGDCAACGNHFEIGNLAVDHIIAKSRGGTDHISNLQLLCTRCNSLKGNRPQEYLTSQLLAMGVIDDDDAKAMAAASADASS